MTETTTKMEDLEDGEIESEGEETTEVQNEERKDVDPVVEEKPDKQEKSDSQDNYYSKSGKKKKSKSKSKEKGKKSRKYTNPLEDDFAGNVEKAIRRAMNKNENEDDVEERRKHKKRKKYDSKDGPSKKRKKLDYADEVDESEMMCVRGASPVQRNSPVATFEDDRESYDSDSSHDSRDQPHRSQRRRPSPRDRSKSNKNDRRRSAHPMQDPDGFCVYYMQGKCHKGDDCIYSHDAQPPRKMELCKFYLMDCCAKRDKCLYMHADFPCKYYHTGLSCVYKDECKFAHGKPLSETLKNILLKHIESAPKEILGDFPRLNREGALKMIHTRQAKLMQQFAENSEVYDKSIPSLFELNIPNPQNTPDSLQMHQFNNERQNRISPKVRHSRWQNDSGNQNSNNVNNNPPTNNSSTTDVLSIKNLTGVLTPRQISDLSKMGIENLGQLGQLTVLQLNSIGISLKQITEIQLNTMSIQKLGLISPNTEQQSQTFMSTTMVGTKDLDLRVPPIVSVARVSSDLSGSGKDVDMRFQSPMPLSDDSSITKVISKNDLQNKDMIDIDQYTKDALKFASKDKENIDISNDTFDNEKSIATIENKDVDHRVLPFSEDTRNVHTLDDNYTKKECDTDIRFLQPDPLFKSPEKKHRRSTTDDDEDNNLLIDEKWYSSDEEKGNKRKSPASSPQPSQSPAPTPHVIEPSAVLNKIGDLSKIDISEEVTKLLNTMKNNLHENKIGSNIDIAGVEPHKLKDPRSKRSPDKLSEPIKSPPIKKPVRLSIYECIEGEPTDGRRRTDVDLRQTDYKLPTFGDTDLRQSTSGDIDFRLGLPFKPIPNYTPASEIDGSINSHPLIPYKLLPIDIPRPDYTDIKNSTAKSQALIDPRLRKVFRLSLEESNSDSEKSIKVTPTGPRVDPRRKPKEIMENTSKTLEQKSNTLDLQTILQNSNWYKDLSSTQKIFVNQNFAPVTQMIKQYQQEKMPGKKFDLSQVQSNTILCSIFANLGISLNENGEYSYLPKPKEALLKTPMNINQNANLFNMNSNITSSPGGIDGSNMNMMNMPALNMGSVNNMNAMNVGHMQGYNQSFSDPRGGPAPGLLGIAPNIPHNFGGPNSFGNMPFNGPGTGNDFNNYMDGDQNYQRFQNRGGHRGRGNDRWNRGSSGRGHRERKNFSDRGNWKNDRH